MARLVGAEADDIIFTSGGTEVHTFSFLWIHEADACSVSILNLIYYLPG